MVGLLDPVDDGAGAEEAVDDRTTVPPVDDDRDDAVDDRNVLAVDDRTTGVEPPLNEATAGPVKKNGIDES